VDYIGGYICIYIWSVVRFYFLIDVGGVSSSIHCVISFCV